MPTLRSNATVAWTGDLPSGSGTVSLASGAAGKMDVSWPSRTEAANGNTSPEELLAAAHAACFCMALSNVLSERGATPEAVEASATCTFVVDDDGARIASMHLHVRGHAAGIDEGGFAEAAAEASRTCPISAALAASVEVTVDAAFA